ncbi:MAG: hypothetical protein V4603_09285, partial [Pseudomonadota bacterium]
MRQLPASTWLTLKVAMFSIPAVLLFFYEYLLPGREVHIPYDLASYHYPLFDYAFLRLKAGDFPIWDPTTYSGMDFVSNVQAALFYPPTWLLFLLGWGADDLSYLAVQLFNIAHVWLAFVFAWLWLSNKKLDLLPCVIGAMVFAFSGFVCTQLQHFGLVAAYAWFPFGLWGIDQACARMSWTPLWKLSVAVAMTFLAGYPPIWFVYLVVVAAYALFSTRSPKIIAAVLMAGLLSIVLIAVQLLPAWEASLYRKTELSYGGIRDPMFFISWFIANFWNFDLDVPVQTNPGRDYFYLGACGLVGLLCLLRFRDNKQRVLPGLAIVIACLFMLADPGELVFLIADKWATFGDLVRAYYFMAGITLGLAVLCAQGLHAWLQRQCRPAPSWMTGLALFGLAAWSLSGLVRWKLQNFGAGWNAAVDTIVLLAIMTLALQVYRASADNKRTIIFLALLAVTAIEFKVLGTSKRFNAAAGPGPVFSATEMIGMNSATYSTLRSQPEFRILLDEWGPFPGDLRHLALRTPNGFDPFLGSRYEELIRTVGSFRTNREFSIDPANDAALQLLGIRYVITADRSPVYPVLIADADFRLMGPDDYYYKVFEYLNATPSYGWEGDSKAVVQMEQWQPEQRLFRTSSSQPGLFTFSEQYRPGWTATIDGTEQTIKPWQTAFQSI